MNPVARLAARIRLVAKSKVRCRITTAQRSVNGFNVQVDWSHSTATTKIEALQMMLAKVRCLPEVKLVISKRSNNERH